MSLALERVTEHLVTESNPPRHDLDGMDSSRCIALHNAILEHGWVASGRTAEDFATSTRPWWHVYGESAEVGRFHPSLRTFLEGARVVPGDYRPETSLFYNVRGLHHPETMFAGPGSSMFDDADMVLTLYDTHEVLAGTPDGLLCVGAVALSQSGLTDMSAVTSS